MARQRICGVRYAAGARDVLRRYSDIMREQSAVLCY